MSRLLLVRHGITEYNTTHRFCGYTDIDLNETGYSQAEKLRDRLASVKIDAVYASDLERTMVTARVISDGHGVDIVACPELREANYGDIEGLTFREIGQNYPDVAKLIANFDLRLAFPGGDSFREFIDRTNTFLDRLKDHEPSESILVVSSSGPLRVLVCTLFGVDQNHWRQVRLDNASLSILDTYPFGAIISLLNDTSHLKEID